MAKPGVMFYFDIRPCIRRLTLEEKGKLFEAILDYGEFGSIPEFDGVLGVAWDFIQPSLDRDSKRYERQIAQKQYAAFVREVKKKGNTPLSFDAWMELSDVEIQRLISSDIGRCPTYNLQSATDNLQSSTDNLQSSTSKSNDGKADKPPSTHRFIPPSVEQVREYCAENGLCVDADRFVDFYESKGWHIGKNAMKSWKAAARNWSSREKERPATDTRNPKLAPIPSYEGAEAWTI